MSSIDTAAVDRIIERHGGSRGTLIAILTAVQREYSWLPPEALRRVAALLKAPESRIFAVSTFYKAFSHSPRGRHAVKVCLGTACHVNGADHILDRLKRELGVDEGGTTADGQFTLETVRCVGCCSIAPVVMVNETAHGRLKQEELPGVLAKYAKHPARRARAGGRRSP